MDLQSLLKLYKSKQEEIEKGFFEFLRFKTISAEPSSAPELNRCAQWLVALLKQAGLRTELWPTPGYPVVFAEWLGAGPDKPTVLMYGHYDVQPVDPLDEWVSDPFEPQVRDGEVYARGAQDNKGQIWYVLAALMSLLESQGELPVNVKLVIEGEEETASFGLSQILKSKSSKLKADHIIVTDLGIHSLDHPSVCLGIRGIVALDVEFKGSNVDLHSGAFGGLAYNPNHALVGVLSSLRKEDGSIDVPGFYDNIAALDDDERAKVCLDAGVESLEEQMELKATGGETAYPPLESAGARPTLEINGVSGGYAGKGFKTVIPALASAKISCRLVPDQEPRRVGELVAEEIRRRTPDGIQVSVNIHSGGGPAVRASASSPIVRAAYDAFEEVLGVKCGFTFEGGSIPIVADLVHTLGADVALMGYGLPGDRMHAPNEHFGLDRLKLGFATIGRMLYSV